MHFSFSETTFFSFAMQVTTFYVAVLCLLGTDSLRLHLLWLANDLIRSALDDAASFGELSTDPHEVGIDVTSGLATFVDAPVDR